MYINLILGALVVGALVWLVRSCRKPKSSPGEILLDEFSKRRTVQEEKKILQERLKSLRHRQLRLIADGLKKMREAMASLPMRWVEHEECLELTLELAGHTPPAEEKFTLRWDIKNLDLEFLSTYEDNPEFYGEYMLQWPDGSISAEAELTRFMRTLSALIADKLA